MRNARVLTSAAALALLATPAPADDDSLARITPPDVGVFIELRSAADLLLPLVEPQAWLTLAQLTGQPAALSETEQWRIRVEQTVGMSPAQAIRTLMAQRVAFIAQSWRTTEDAAIVCRPGGDPQAFVSRWQTRPQPFAGRATVYRLPYNVGLAVRDDLLIFGDAASQGMFTRLLTFNDDAQQPTLASDPTYTQLLRRVPPNPDGVLFARLGPSTDRAAEAPAAPATATATQPFAQRLSDLPRPLSGSSSILLALHRSGPLLHVNAVGDAVPAAPPPDGSRAALIRDLPVQTLLAWAGRADYEDLIHAARSLPETSLYRMVFEAQERSGVIGRLRGALRSTACVAVGPVAPAARAAPAPPIPAAAVLVATRDADAAGRELARLVNTTLALAKLLALKLAAPPNIPPLEPITIAGLPAQFLDLSSLLGAAPEQTPLGEIHLAWAVDEDVLIIATHADWLRQIILARHAQAARLTAVLELSQHTPAEHQETIVVAQSGPLADLGSLWLAYFEKTAPYVLSERWWRTNQPGGENVRLGVQATTNSRRQSLTVVGVTPNSPADGILRPGDEIVGCNQRRFATSQPVEEIQAGLRQRPNARWFDVLVERNRVIRLRRIPLPFVDPVEVLRRLISIGQIVQRVIYFDDVPDAAGSRGHLTLELRTDAAPLIPFERMTPEAARLDRAPVPRHGPPSDPP